MKKVPASLRFNLSLQQTASPPAEISRYVSHVLRRPSPCTLLCYAVLTGLCTLAQAAASDAGSPMRATYASMPTPTGRFGMTFGTEGLLSFLDSDVALELSFCPQRSEFHCVRFKASNVPTDHQLALAVPRQIIGTNQVWNFAGAKFSIVRRENPPPPVSDGAVHRTYDVQSIGVKISAYLVKVETTKTPSRTQSFLYSPTIGIVAITGECSAGQPPDCSQLVLGQSRGLFSVAYEGKLSPEAQLTTDFPSS